MSWYGAIGCNSPSWEEEALTVSVDLLMIGLSSSCLIITVYGTFRYIIDHKKLQQTNSIKPAKPLYIGGLVFFVISLITLLNAFIYDAMYLICPRYDDIEGPIYHAIYFIQIFCLWVVLFLRIHYVFKKSAFELSKFVIRLYITLFCLALGSVIPIYLLFQADADAFITLPYVILSAVFSTSILFTFIHKLIQIFTKLGQDELLLKTMVKHTILAISSISCTFLVIITLIILYVKHDGFHDRRSVLEELILELFILIDVVSNFICVLFSYSFFDKKFQLICGKFNDKMVQFASKKISSSMDGKNKSRERTFTGPTQTQPQPHIHLTNVVTESQMTVEPSNDRIEPKQTDVIPEETEIEVHKPSKTKTVKPVASLILKLSNSLGKKSNSRSKSKKNVDNVNDILLTLVDDTETDIPSFTQQMSDGVIGINNKNQINLRPIRSEPVPNLSSSK